MSWSIQACILSEIQAYACGAYPQECCGMLLGNGEAQSVEAIYPAQNKSAEAYQGVQFLIDPMELYRAEKAADARGMQVVGIYHSHPDHPACFSEKDETYMIPGLLYYIVSVAGGAIAEQKSYLKTDLCGTAVELQTDCESGGR